ncbi:hypothetical protein DCAR_0205379 [Daucus carota subsp. sativus]|uniref:HTH La-type RNA-binding domain-containing protein n=1 Tax=Daucus carota subsp. sativus TaxID=79200 RepID=A0AAF0WDB8_DAUCS|nr:hypothetical protein DCAR_0205379 [Daucus carota subsp. sativus]
MAQAHPPEKIKENPDQLEINSGKMKEITCSTSGGSSSSNNTSVPFKFNVQAPEFVPSAYNNNSNSPTHMPVSGYFYPCFHYISGNDGAADWVYVGDQDSLQLVSSPPPEITNYAKDVLTAELKQKIIKQAEYQFSAMSLLANESLIKQINKDPEGYVPISFIASTKKIKSLVSNSHSLAQALRSSSKLVVSSDGKKVKRKHPFTEKDKEDLQSRTIVVENLPEDHSHQNLEKIFNVVGSVKTIRICHPPDVNSPRPKGNIIISNKLHALVEYETPELAERAVDKLNDERNWRKGLRVTLLLRRSPKSVLKNRKSEFDGYFDDDCDEDDTPGQGIPENSSQPISLESAVDNLAEESSAAAKKGWARGRGKSRLRAPIQTGRGSLLSSPMSSSSPLCEGSSTKQATKGPRMPDGTRGFTLGRGKPICTSSAAISKE